MIDFIHIGYQKTASTWLQANKFFHPNIQFFRLKNHKKLMWDFVLKSKLVVDDSQFRDRFNAACSEMEGDKINGISWERLSGEMRKGYDSTLLAKRIRNTFGPVKIIIILRSQVPMLESSYSQYIKMGGSCDFKTFISDDNIAGQLLIDRVKYYGLVDLYRKLFGEENVYVGFYEDLKSQPEVFVKGIWKFLGLKDIEINISQRQMNYSLSPPSFFIMRLINHFFPLKFNTTPFIGLPIGLHDFIRRKVLENGVDYLYAKLGGSRKKLFDALDASVQEDLLRQFVQSNQELSEILNVDLNELGYPMPKDGNYSAPQ